MRAKVTTTARRIFHSVFSALWRSRNASALFILSLALLFLFIHLLSLGGAFSSALIENFEKKADIPVVMQESATLPEIDAFRRELLQKKEKGEIVKYWEFSREDALKEFKRRYPAETGFIDRYNIENPLVTVFGVVPPPDSSEMEDLRAWILSDQWHGVVDQKRFRKTTDLQKRVQRFLNISVFSGKGVFLFQFLFTAIACSLVFYSVFVMVRSHRKEITIMRLVGARLFYIRTPFILEGVLLAGIALVVSSFLFWWIVSLVSAWVEGALGELHITDSFLTEFFQNGSLFAPLLLHNSLLLIFFSFIAAFLGVEHALRKTSLSEVTG